MTLSDATDLTLPELATLNGCIFAPANASPRSLFAQDITGALQHISEVETGAKGLTCPDCKTPLVAKKGDVLAHHFAHASEGECRTAGETALHLLAKEIIARKGALRLPKVVAPGPEGPVLLHREKKMTFDRVEVEPWQDGIRPDLIATKTVTRNGVPEERRLLVEILVTHAVDDRKIGILKARRETALQIDLSGVRERLDHDGLVSAILNSAPRDWVTHHEIEEHQRREVERRAEEERRRAERQRREAEARGRRIEAQAQALLEPPRPASEVERAWARAERDRWLSLGTKDPTRLRFEDRIFAVAPYLWRLEALADFGPWNWSTNPGTTIRTPWVMPMDLAPFRKKGFVKPAFWPEVLAPPGEAGQRDVAVREHVATFRLRFLYELLHDAGLPIRPTFAEDARALLAQRWHRLSTHRGLLLQTIETLDENGLELHAVLHSPDEPGEVHLWTLRTGKDLDSLLATGWMEDQPLHDSTLKGFVADLQAGFVRRSGEEWRALLDEQDYAIMAPGDIGGHLTQQALKVIAGRRVQSGTEARRQNSRYPA